MKNISVKAEERQTDFVEPDLFDKVREKGLDLGGRVVVCGSPFKFEGSSVKQSLTFDTMREALDHAKQYGGRVASMYNSSQAMWFSAGYTPTDISKVGGVELFGVWSSWVSYKKKEGVTV